jgi:hypothetical protein
LLQALMPRCAACVAQVLVTKQTGPAGKPVNTLYLAKKMKLANEMYFAILLDRATAGPIIIACSEGAQCRFYCIHSTLHELAGLAAGAEMVRCS